MTFYTGPGDSLGSNLDLVIDNYQADRESYWSEDPTEEALVKAFDWVAEALLRASENLVLEGSNSTPSTSSPFGSVIELTEKPGFGEQLVEAIEILIARDAVDKLADTTTRCLGLARFVLSEQPSEAVQKYLARLGRCYIAGFLPECVMLCRAVLENGVKDAFVRRRVPLPATAEGASPMRTRLKAAQMFGWLTPDGFQAATAVWERGNTAVHHDPTATSDVLGTIVLTVNVLKELYD
jgi:hypothetical protein